MAPLVDISVPPHTTGSTEESDRLMQRREHVWAAYAPKREQGLDVRRPDLLGVDRTGTVRWFKEEKGYGRITADDGEVLFVHFSDVVADGYRFLVADQRVQFFWKAGLWITVVTTPKMCAFCLDAFSAKSSVTSRGRIHLRTRSRATYPRPDPD